MNIVSFLLLCVVSATYADDTFRQRQQLKHDIEELKENFRRQKDEIRSLQMTIGNLKQENVRLAEQQVERIEKLSDKMKSIKYRRGRQTDSEGIVAFYAHLTTDITNMGNHQTIRFDQVQTNVGNAYNASTGEFTAPMKGTYVFAWTNTNKDRSYMNTELTVNGVVTGKAMSDAMDHIDYAAASNVAVVNIEADDTVLVRSGTWHNGMIAGSLYSSFSGWIIY